jgi:hypothetical protein
MSHPQRFAASLPLRWPVSTQAGLRDSLFLSLRTAVRSRFVFGRAYVYAGRQRDAVRPSTAGPPVVSGPSLRAPIHPRMQFSFLLFWPWSRLSLPEFQDVERRDRRTLPFLTTKSGGSGRGGTSGNFARVTANRLAGCFLRHLSQIANCNALLASQGKYLGSPLGLAKPGTLANATPPVG